MKIAFYVYPTAFQSPGGGEIMLLKTKEYLEKAGLRIKLFDPWNDKLSAFDLLHTFGSVKDCLPVMRSARAQGIKNVLSSVCWYSWKSAWGTYPDLRCKLTGIIHHAAKTFLPFFPSERKVMMDLSDAVLPNSAMEADQLRRFFCVPKEKIRVIPNAADASFSNARPELFSQRYGLKDFVLCVGRIEPRKNQLNVIRALKGISRPVVVIGEPVSHYQDYYERCRREADKNVHFLGGLPHGSDLLRSAYAACDTFLLATWLETPGLAALEAGLAGAKLVITQEGSTREYFGDLASYVMPDRADDIREKTLGAIDRPKDGKLKNHIQLHYTWEKAAGTTLELYRDLLTTEAGSHRI